MRRTRASLTIKIHQILKSCLELILVVKIWCLIPPCLLSAPLAQARQTLLKILKFYSAVGWIVYWHFADRRRAWWTVWIASRVRNAFSKSQIRQSGPVQRQLISLIFSWNAATWIQKNVISLALVTTINRAKLFMQKFSNAMLSGQLGNSLSMIDENLDLMQTNQLFISEIFRTSKYFMLLRLGLGFG